MSQERLQKIMARAGVASRRKSEDIIRAGRVTVNGQVAEIGQSADPEEDAIKVDGKLLQPRTTYHYYLLNKPGGVISTKSDPEGRPTVMDYVPKGLRKALVPVGRLDFHTEGLILLTDDGDLAHRVAHPRYGCTKVYEVKVSGEPSQEALNEIRQGMVIDGRRTAPVEISASPEPKGPKRTTENSWWTVKLQEGRTRQIREMFFRIDHPVQRLIRTAIGTLTDPNLPTGSLRELTSRELEALRQSTRRGGGSRKKGRRR